MNVSNNFLIILLIFCAIAVDNISRSSKIKPRKGVPFSTTALPLPPAPTDESTANSNKTVGIKTTLKPKVSNSTNLEVTKHKGREGVVEKYHKIEINKAQAVEKQNKAIIQTIINSSSTTSTTVNPSIMLNDNSISINVDHSKTLPNENSTTSKPIGKVDVVATSGIKSTTLVSSNNATNIKLTTTTIKPTTTKKTTTTTTTPKPIKPKLSLSIEDYPSIGSVIKQSSITENSKLPIDEPIVQSSREIESRHFYTNRRHDYFIAIVSMIFILPLLMGIIIVAYRKFNEFWSTRHYRRMDFLIEGMYD